VYWDDILAQKSGEQTRVDSTLQLVVHGGERKAAYRASPMLMLTGEA
jgi:hypothetical protein